MKLPKIIPREKVKELLSVPNIKAPTGLRNRVALELMYRAGLRVSEVCNLSPDDIDLEKGFLYVQQGKNKKDRVVPLDQETICWCKKWNEIRPSSKYFITTLKGGKISQRYIREMCYRYSKKSGVYINDNHVKKPVRPHVLRHCFATELLEEGFSIREVQEILGHKNINTTMIYTHVRPEKLAEKIRARNNGRVAI